MVDFANINAMKHYINPEDYRRDSYILDAKVVDDGFIPDFIVAKGPLLDVVVMSILSI